MQGRAPNSDSGTTDLKGAARFFGVSENTFRQRLMPKLPWLEVSAPDRKRKRRRFPITALEEYLKSLVKPAAA